MASTVVGNGIDCCCKWHRLLLQMALTVVADGMTVVADGNDGCCRWHRLLLQMASTVVANGINCCCKWYQLLEKASAVYERVASVTNTGLSRLLRATGAIESWCAKATGSGCSKVGEVSLSHG